MICVWEYRFVLHEITIQFVAIFLKEFVVYSIYKVEIMDYIGDRVYEVYFGFRNRN